MLDYIPTPTCSFSPLCNVKGQKAVKKKKENKLLVLIRLSANFQCLGLVQLKKTKLRVALENFIEIVTK